jgi:hypothetical protein
MSGWQVISHPVVGEWYAVLDDEDRVQVAARVDYLAERGPGLGRPIVDTITASRHSNMKN